MCRPCRFWHFFLRFCFHVQTCHHIGGDHGGAVTSLLYATPPPSRNGPKAPRGGGGGGGGGIGGGVQGGAMGGGGGREGGMCILFEICQKIPFQKCMRWGGGGVRWSHFSAQHNTLDGAHKHGTAPSNHFYSESSLFQKRDRGGGVRGQLAWSQGTPSASPPWGPTGGWPLGCGATAPSVSGALKAHYWTGRSHVRAVGRGGGGRVLQKVWPTLQMPPRVIFRRVVAPLRGPGQSPIRPFACCVGSLRSVGCCGPCSCWCRFHVRGAQPLAYTSCVGCSRLRVSGAQ